MELPRHSMEVENPLTATSYPWGRRENIENVRQAHYHTNLNTGLQRTWLCLKIVPPCLCFRVLQALCVQSTDFIIEDSLGLARLYALQTPIDDPTAQETAG